MPNVSFGPGVARQTGLYKVIGALSWMLTQFFVRLCSNSLGGAIQAVMLPATISRKGKNIEIYRKQAIILFVCNNCSMQFYVLPEPFRFSVTYRFIPHFRAIEFKIESGERYRIIENYELDNVLLVTGDPPEGLKRTTAIPMCLT